MASQNKIGNQFGMSVSHAVYIDINMIKVDQILISIFSDAPELHIWGFLINPFTDFNNDPCLINY